VAGQVDSNRQVALRALGGAAYSTLRDPQEFRYRVVRDSWTMIKRFGARSIEDVEIREVPCVRDAVIEGYIDDPNRAVLAALTQGLGARTFFEIGTNRGRTTWTVARNNPHVRVLTLDLPTRESIDQVRLDVNDSDREFFVDEWDRGEAFADTPEASRITQLWGDSASFDFSPYDGEMDVVFVDGAHSYSYVRNDTEAALRMLSPRGAILWDDYPGIPGVYRYITELAPTLNPPPVHILGTRLVLYSRVPVVERLAERFGRLRQA
jgi:hypothetical protein